jgi:hypothetical protein
MRKVYFFPPVFVESSRSTMWTHCIRESHPPPPNDKVKKVVLPLPILVPIYHDSTMMNLNILLSQDLKPCNSKILSTNRKILHYTYM